VCSNRNIYKDKGVKLDKEQWHENIPKLVGTSPERKVTILWNQQVQIDRTNPKNKPDIVIGDNEKGECMLTDVGNSGDRNVIKKEAEKILKYKDLTIEIQRVWNVKTKMMLIIKVATGIISKSFRKYLSNREEARSKGTAENSRIWHSTHTAEVLI
jgi:hypothetical protein